MEHSRFPCVGKSFADLPSGERLMWEAYITSSNKRHWN
jgi:hypothetical protein